MYVESLADWDQWLHLATFSYNTNVHESTKHTLYELVPENEDLLRTYDEYLGDLITRLNELQAHAKERLIESKVRNKKYYDKKVNPQDFKINDYVWLLKGGKIHKHERQYRGPFPVMETYPSGNLKIRISPTLTKTVHANRLKMATLPEEQENTNQ